MVNATQSPTSTYNSDTSTISPPPKKKNDKGMKIFKGMKIVRKASLSLKGVYLDINLNLDKEAIRMTKFCKVSVILMGDNWRKSGSIFQFGSEFIKYIYKSWVVAPKTSS